MKLFNRYFCTLILVFLACLAAAPQAQAQITFTLSPSFKTGVQGQELIFSGTLFNPTASTIFLNDMDFLWTPAPAGNNFTIDPNVFFSNTPGTLDPSETYTGPIFGVVIKPTAANGVYNGTAEILGGPDPDTFDVVGSSPFTIAVGAPEPGAIALLVGVGVCSVPFMLHRRRAR
jgi:hypothetical protein